VHATLTTVSLVLLLGREASATPAASDLYRRGAKCFRAKDHACAAALLTRAVDADEASAGYRYLLARALSRLRAAGKACGHSADRRVITGHLDNYLGYSTSVRSKATIQAEPDFESIRDTVWYQTVILGLSLIDPADSQPLLEAVAWSGESGDEQPWTTSLDFRPGGEVSLDIRARAGFAAAPPSKRYRGQFTLSGEKIVIALDEPFLGSSRFDGELVDVRLQFAGELGAFNDRPEDDCPYDTRGALVILTKSSPWSSEDTEMHGSLQQLRFSAGGKVRLRERRFDPDNERPLEPRVVKGSYKVDASQVTVRFAFPVNGARLWTGVLNGMGNLEFHDQGRFFDGRSSEAEGRRR
jgi:hypothetical protein